VLSGSHILSGIELKYILIDATECPVERPKKAKIEQVGLLSNLVWNYWGLYVF